MKREFQGGAFFRPGKGPTQREEREPSVILSLTARESVRGHEEEGGGGEKARLANR